MSPGLSGPPEARCCPLLTAEDNDSLARAGGLPWSLSLHSPPASPHHPQTPWFLPPSPNLGEETPETPRPHEVKGLRFLHGLENNPEHSLQIPHWQIPWTEEPGRLQSMGSLRVGHD